MNVPVPDTALSAPATSLTPAELADALPRMADQKPCSNPTCPLRYAHRGPCAPSVTAAVRRAMVVLGNQDPGWTRDTLAAALDGPVDDEGMDEATMAVHVALCEDSPWDCLDDYDSGQCVRAVKAVRAAILGTDQ